MASTQLLIFYSIATGRARCIRFIEDDSYIPRHSCGKGEAILIYPRNAPGGAYNHQLAVNIITGITPENDTHAIIDAATVNDDGSYPVVGTIICDPDGCGDSLMGSDGETPCLLIPHDTACAGWTYTPPVAQSFGKAKISNNMQISVGTFNAPAIVPLTDEQQAAYAAKLAVLAGNT